MAGPPREVSRWSSSSALAQEFEGGLEYFVPASADSGERRPRLHVGDEADALELPAVGVPHRLPREADGQASGKGDGGDLSAVREAMSDRATDLSFVRIRPSSAFLGRLAQVLQADEARRITLLETAASLAHNLRADLVEHFGTGLSIAIRIAGPSGIEPKAFEDGVWIVSPQNWDRLGQETRRRPDVVPLRYEIEPHDLERLGVERGWRRRAREGTGTARYRAFRAATAKPRK